MPRRPGTAQQIGAPQVEGRIPGAAHTWTDFVFGETLEEMQMQVSSCENLCKGTPKSAIYRFLWGCVFLCRWVHDYRWSWD